MTTKRKKPATQRLSDLRNKIEERQAEVELLGYETKLFAGRSLIENLAAESYATAEIVNRWDYRPPEIQRGLHAPDSTLGDRRDGRNEPFVQTEFDVNVIRGVARLVCEITTTGKAIEKNLKNYVIGFGLNHDVAPKRPKDLGTDGLKEDLQEFIDDFLERNDWDADLDRELFWRACRDGERFVPTYPQADGTCKVRQVEPEQVQQPAGQPFTAAELLSRWPSYMDPSVEMVASDWTFGVHTAEHDVQTVFGFHIRWDESSGSYYLPEAICLHSKRNVDRNIKRGMSDFYPAWKKILSQDKLENRTGSGAAARAGIAYIVAHAEGTTSTDIESLNQANAAYNRARMTNTGSEEIPVRDHEGATRLDVDKGREYLQSMMGTDPAVAAIDVMNALARSAGKVWQMPEHMISGDASNNNYASILEAGTPFANCVSYEQWSYAEFKQKILWRAVRHACSCGRFDRWGREGVYTALKRRFAVTITPPDIKEGDRLAETQRRDVLYQRGIITRKQWQMEEGYDPEEQEAMVAEDQQGQAPGGEFGGLGRRQFTNNTKAVDDILAAVADGTRSEGQALQMLGALGLSGERSQALLDDARPETPEAMAPAAETVARIPDAQLAQICDELWRRYP